MAFAFWVCEVETLEKYLTCQDTDVPTKKVSKVTFTDFSH